MTSTFIKIDNADRDTILAALRTYQEAGYGDPNNRPDRIQMIACPTIDDTSLDDSAIDGLCERINCGCDIETADECPNCGDVGTVVGDGVDIDDNMATQVCYCQACEAEWIIGFGLVTVDMVEK